MKPHLEAMGFRYSRSKLLFTRKKEIAVQEIVFQLDRYNSENDCRFWTHWNTRAPTYADWLDQHFSGHDGYGHLGGAAEWNVPGWSRNVAERACLRNGDQDDAVMRRLIDDVTRSGIPWLDSISTWHGAAKQLIKENWFFARIADYYLLAGDRTNARSTILNAIQLYTVGGRSDQNRELPELQLRLARFFPENQSSSAKQAIPIQPSSTTTIDSISPDDLLNETLATGDVSDSTVFFEPQQIVRELKAYGEQEAADRIVNLNANDLRMIGRRAYEIWSTFSGERGPILDKAICLAVVEFNEGNARELKRKRRHYAEKTT